MSGDGDRDAAAPFRPVGPVVAAARQEAERAGHGYVGVEHLLIVLADDRVPTGGLLADQQVTSAQAREAVRDVIASGRGDGPRWNAAVLLATLGVDLDVVSRQVEERFGPDAITRLHSSDVGWNLRRRGPLCGPPLTPHLKRTLGQAVGKCWDTAVSRLHERLLLGALDADSAGLNAVLGQLGVSVSALRATVAAELRIAS